MSSASHRIAMTAPEPVRRPVLRTVHGVLLSDEYAWLKAENWREALGEPGRLPAQIHNHLLAENAYADAVLAPLEGLRQRLLQDLRELIPDHDEGPPQPFGDYIYRLRYKTGADHPTVVRGRREGSGEQVLVDFDAMARQHAFFSLGAWRPSPTHGHLAYATDVAAAELFTITVRDLATGVDLDERIPATSGRMVWSRDGMAFLYVRLDQQHRPSRVYCHRLGQPPAGDALIYEEPNPAWLVGLSETQSGRFATLGIRRAEDSEVHTIDLSRPDAPPRLVAPRRPGHRYDLDHGGSLFVMRTNAGGAEEFKLAASPDTPDALAWRDLVPHRPGVTIVAHRCNRGGVARLERENAVQRLVMTDLDTGADRTIDTGEDVHGLSLDPLFEPESPTVRFTISTPVRPGETYDLDPRRGSRTLARRQSPRRSIDPEDYVTRRLWASAPDGESVPISVVHRRDVQLDGTAPCLLYAYGSYGWATQPSFAPERLPLLDRGFVYAIAHVRGGGERGQRWYRAGKLVNRPASFSDFIAVAEALVAARYTQRGRIVALGRSAGGTIMGAVANQAPALFAGIIADVPFVDVLNTMLDADLPLTPTEWAEWGNPIRDAEAFATIRAYSPYEGVRAQIYPPILATAGIADPRVTYWEPAKWIARLRATAAGGGPFFIRTNLTSGHSGRDGRFGRLQDRAYEIAFALRCLGME